MPKLLQFLFHVSRPIHFLRWIVFIVGVIVLWGIVENPILQTFLQERDRRDNYLSQVEQLQQQQQDWQAEVADLKAGGYRLEKAIHDRFPMLRPGQKMLIFHAPGEKLSPEQEKFDPAALPDLPPGDPADADPATVKKPTAASPAAPAKSPAVSAKTSRTPNAKTSGAKSTKSSGKPAAH